MKTLIPPLIVAGVCGLPVGAAPFTNGSFEDAGLSPWTGSAVYQQTSPSNAKDGSKYALLLIVLGFNNVASLQQTFDTVAGHTYRIDYYLGNSQDSFANDTTFTASFDATSVTAPNTTTGFQNSADYFSQSFTSLASSTSTTLRFDAYTTDANTGFFVDQVSITDLGATGAPELNGGRAGFQALSLMALMLLAQRQRRPGLVSIVR